MTSKNLQRGVAQRIWISLALLLCLCVALFCAGCDGGDGETLSSGSAQIKGTGEKTTGKWVVEMYLCGTDLESNIGAASADLAELMKKAPPEGVTFVIQTGGAKKWESKDVKKGEIGRYVYDKDGLKKLEKQPDADMAATDTFASFLHFAQQNFEADHRILIVWDHGGGTVGGACYDERSGNMMSLNQMQDAMASVYDKNTQKPPFDIIGFDCCLMATYGVANNFEGYGRYLVASEELEPGNGWYYTGIVEGFNEGVGSDPLVLAKVMCDSYMQGCKDRGTDDEATLSIVDLGKLPELREAYEKMGAEAIKAASKDPKKFFSRYARQAKNSENFGGNTRDTGFTNMIDMGDFAKRTAELLPDTSKAVQKALDATVLYRVSGSLKQDSLGLSCYYPYEVRMQKAFEDVRAASPCYKALYRYLATGEAPEVPEIPEAQHMPQLSFDIASMEDLPVQVDKDGTVYSKLEQKQLENLSAIRCDLIWYDQKKNVIFMFGNDADITVDWDAGTCKANFNGKWMMLDKHLIYTDVVEQDNEHILYAVPIKLNGKQMNMFVVYEAKNKGYRILGARAGLNAQGAADRNLVKLKEGDTVTTLQYAMSIDKKGKDLTLVELDTFKLGKNFKVADEPLGDGTYAYVFDFITPTGDYAMSDMALYDVNKGKVKAST